MADRSDDRPIPELEPEQPTGEVGSEGGSPGNVEQEHDTGAATGSEAGETWKPAVDDTDDVVRDETGEGRRNPS